VSLMKSWVESANSAATDFPLNNLPCGVFSIGDEDARCGVAIGDFILDVTSLEAEGLLTLAEHPLFDVPFWNELMDQGSAAWDAFRAEVTALLAEGSSKRWLIEDHLVKRSDVTLHLPFLVSEYTDFPGHATWTPRWWHGAFPHKNPCIPTPEMAGAGSHRCV